MVCSLECCRSVSVVVLFSAFYHSTSLGSLSLFCLFICTAFTVFAIVELDIHFGGYHPFLYPSTLLDALFVKRKNSNTSIVCYHKT